MSWSITRTLRGIKRRANKRGNGLAQYFYKKKRPTRRRSRRR